MSKNKVFEFICLGFLLFMVVSLGVTGYRKHWADHMRLQKKAEEEIKTEITTLKQNNQELQLTIEEHREHLKRLEESNEEQSMLETMQEQLLLNKRLSGLTDLVGPGIYISISDNQSREVVGETVMSDIVHDSDVLSIINDLKVAGAEAISINGERVLSTTGINCGGPVILVNQESLTAPFVVKAIGDPKLLYAAVTARGTTAYILKNVYELDLHVKTSDYILIPKYSHDLKTDYISMYGEGGE